MAIFGNPNSFVGLDIGTSSLKIVELVNRKRRIEVATYAQADLPNILIHPEEGEDAAVDKVVKTIQSMMNSAKVSADAVVAALPAGIVFSTVIDLPPLPNTEIEKAVNFEARDLVPADINDMIIGWSRVGEDPHMSTDKQAAQSGEASNANTAQAKPASDESIPIFLTAAPKDVIERYTKVIKKLNLELYALEVETFPLARSLLNGQEDSGLIVDIGDLNTTFHVIDRGTPYVSYTIEYGGHNISQHVSKRLSISIEEAEEQKKAFGLTSQEQVSSIIAEGMAEIIDKAKEVLRVYQSKNQRTINKSVLIGGGANLLGLPNLWAKQTGHKTIIGNPWKGLSYPDKLEGRLQLLGPTYAVAVGLALRGTGAVQ